MSDYYIYYKGRWCALDLQSGHIVGWREKPLFVYSKSGRLNLASTATVLQGLRDLLAGQPSTIQRGPRIPRQKNEASRGERRGKEQCCERAPPQHRWSGDLECSGPPQSSGAVLRSIAAAVSAALGASVAAGPPPASAPPPAAALTLPLPQLPAAPPATRLNEAAATKRKLSESSTISSFIGSSIGGVDGHEANRCTRAKTEVSTVTRGAGRSPNAKNDAKRHKYLKISGRAASTESGSSETAPVENCKELIIDERDIVLLRNYLEKSGSLISNFDRNLFDSNETYKAMVFYKINPLVRVERSERIGRLLWGGSSGPEDGKALKDFAIKLGLRHVTDAVFRKKRYKTRKSIREGDEKRREHSFRAAARDDDDKENRSSRVPETNDAEPGENEASGAGKTLGEKNGKTEGKDVRSGLAEKSEHFKTENKEILLKSKYGEKKSKVSSSGTAASGGDLGHIRKKMKLRHFETELRKTNAEQEASSKKRVTFLKPESSDTSSSSMGELAGQGNKNSSRRMASRTASAPMTKNKKDSPEKEIDAKARTSEHRPRRSSSEAARPRPPVPAASRELAGRTPAASREPAGLTKRSSVPPGREYSALEDQAIVAWISAGGGRERKVNGNRIWKDLQENYFRITGQSRSWHSVRNRYLRYILPDLARLALPPDQAARLRAAAARGEIKQKKGIERRKPPAPSSAWSRRPPPAPATPAPALDSVGANKSRDERSPAAARSLRSSVASGGSPARPLRPRPVAPGVAKRKLYTATSSSN